MTQLTAKSIFKKYFKDTVTFICSLLYLTAENTYWCIRALLTFSKHFAAQRTVRKHRKFFFIHDLFIKVIIAVCVWLILASVGLLEQSTSTGMSFFLETITSIAMFGSGIGILSVIGLFNRWYEYDDEEYDDYDN